jgi:putative FmdB family regulatory protein
MPIYEYRCQSCGERVALLVRSGSREPRCPSCDSTLLDKLFSAAYMISANSRPEARSWCGQGEHCEAQSCPMAESCERA